MSSKLSPRLNIVDFIVVWIVGETNLPNAECYRITNSIVTFDDVNQCVNYIRDTKNESIILVISDSFIQEVVSEIHDLPQLDSIYVVYSSKQEENNTSYAKLKGTFPDIACLCEHLRQDIRVAEENTTPISIISSSATSSEDLNTLDPSFMYSQLLKEILFELRYDIQARQRFIRFCREQYAADARELLIIDEFERDYENHSPAWWYTRECFLYKMLNKALRTQDINISCEMGFFIRDLHEQLKHLHSTALPNALRVLYRGQG
jgi:hypothetical protein